MNIVGRVVANIKHRSNVTLRSWSYQCESIAAQQSRRVQQLFSFYHRVYGSQGLKRLIGAYRKQLQPPLHGMVLSAVGAVGLSFQRVSHAFDWSRERLSLTNFDMCRRDIEFLDTLHNNKLCPLCKANGMKYCYCQLGNKMCRGPNGQLSIRSCRRSLQLQGGYVDGRAKIESAEDNKWEPYLSKDSFSIWRREERTAMYAYKVYARFDDITAEQLLQVQTDIKYRREWDDTALALEVIEEDPTPGSYSHVIYWEMQWPRLFSNRDYVYARRYVTDDKRNVMMVCSRGTSHPAYPVYSDKVRVKDYWSLMVIRPFKTFNQPGVHYILTYYDDPGVPIPQNIKSWVTQKQMPEFLRKMYEATKKLTRNRMSTIQHILSIASFNMAKRDYEGNKQRPGWLRRVWRTRDPGE